jgi:hypothetical protein
MTEGQRIPNRPFPISHRLADALTQTNLRRYRSKRSRLAVYLIREGMSDLFKVGLTNDPPKRLADLKTGSGRPDLVMVRLVWLWRETARRFEQEFLTSMWEHHVAGEWVRAPVSRALDLFDDMTSAARANGLIEEPEEGLEPMSALPPAGEIGPGRA